MKKILFLSASDLTSSNSGGRQVSKRNFELLKNFGEVDLIYLSREIKEERIEKNEFVFKSTQSKIHTFISNCFLYSGYLTFLSERKILKLVNKKKYDIVFLDTSNYGRILKKVKRSNPNIICITFFHNLEYDYVKERIKVEGSLFYPQLLSSYYNEKKVVELSDYLITLNSRDSKRLFEKYKRKSNLELPISFKDTYKKQKEMSLTSEKIYLFVGSLFYANYSGIKWLINNVMPFVEGKLIVIGKDFELKSEELKRDNVEIVGTVESVEKYYKLATGIVAPIFDGAGMKVKTAEALMYGKSIIGTEEAFEGYNTEKYKGIFFKCKTAEEFIQAMKILPKEKFNNKSRELYLEDYSFKSSILKIKKIFDKINQK